MKILLTYLSGLPHRDDPYISLVPTGLCFIHACLREAGCNSLLANFSAWTSTQIKKELLAFKPDIIGISQWTHNRHNALELASFCRLVLPECRIVMGGGHATFCHDDILKEGSPVDFVVLGEGESTMLELVSSLSSGRDWSGIAGLAFRHNGEITITAARDNLDNLDKLPLPAAFLEFSVGLDVELQSEFIVTTRGCPSRCFFCSSPDFWGGKVRFRSPSAIVAEILYIRHKYGQIYFSIRDDTFTADRNRVLEFCNMLIDQKIYILWNCQSRVTAIDEELLVAMKRAGCECIQLGVESGSLHILHQLGKRITPVQIVSACTLIKESGINLSIYLICNVPGETDADIRETVDLIRRIQPDDGYVSPLAYYPGTTLFKEALSAGRIEADIFAKKGASALYAASPAGKSSARLLRELSKNRRSLPWWVDSVKERPRGCFTSNVIAGEWYRQQGDYRKAEEKLFEITTMDADNPWGWFLLGDLYAELGRRDKGRKCYKRVLEIVPRHGPSIKALATE